MLTRKQFKEVMADLKELDEIEAQVNKAMKMLSPDFMGFSLEKPFTTIVKVLEYSMEDTENSWISYWMYDLERGRKAEHGTVTEKDGSDIPMKTVDDLYNLLAKDPENAK